MKPCLSLFSLCRGFTCELEDIPEVIVKMKNQQVLTGATVVKLYGAETKDVNKAVANNPGSRCRRPWPVEQRCDRAGRQVLKFIGWPP